MSRGFGIRPADVLVWRCDYAAGLPVSGNQWISTNQSRLELRQFDGRNRRLAIPSPSTSSTAAQPSDPQRCFGSDS